MRNKSIINVKNFVAAGAAGAVSYGAIIAESYWRQTPGGLIEESTPTTSEILEQIFYPFRPTVKQCRIYINKLFTGLIIDEQIGPRGVHTERIIFDPLAAEINDTPGFANQQCRENFREHWTAND